MKTAHKILIAISISMVAMVASLNSNAQGSNGGHISKSVFVTVDSAGVTFNPNFTTDSTSCSSGVDVAFSVEVVDSTVRIKDLSSVNVINGNFDVYWQFSEVVSDSVSSDTFLYLNMKINSHTTSSGVSGFSHRFNRVTDKGTYIVTLYYQKWYNFQNGCLEETSTGILEPNTGNAKIFSVNKELTVNSDVNFKQVQVFNVAGQLMADFKTNTDRQVFSLSELTNGIYIVSVMDANSAITNKRIIVM